MTEENLTKTCSVCQETKSLSDFSKKKGGKHGVSAMCKICMKAYYQKYREEHLAFIHKYYELNKERINKRRRKRYELNKDEINKRSREYQKNHKGERKAYHHKYHKINKEKRIKQVMQWRENNHEKIKSYSLKNSHKRRALKLNSTVEDFTPSEVFERDGYICQLCGCKTRPDFKNKYHPKYPNLDHIIALSKGGEHSKRNTQCLCYRCNVTKNNNEHFGDQLRMFG